MDQHQPTTLECIVQGKPTPEVHWYVKDQPLNEDIRRKITYDEETGKATLTILEPQPMDEVIYRVQAINRHGRAECRANLIISEAVKIQQPVVMRAPKITKPLEAIFLIKGESTVLEVETTGQPKPEIKWYKNNKELTNEEIIEEDDKTRLAIASITREQCGTYEVRAVNPAGIAKTSGTVRMTALKSPEEASVQPPRFIAPLSPQFVAEGEVAIMETRVDSYPTCSFQWFQESVPIVVSTKNTPTIHLFFFFYSLQQK